MSPKNKIKLNILRKKLDKIDHKLLKVIKIEIICQMFEIVKYYLY